MATSSSGAASAAVAQAKASRQTVGLKTAGLPKFVQTTAAFMTRATAAVKQGADTFNAQWTDPEAKRIALSSEPGSLKRNIAAWKQTKADVASGKVAPDVASVKQARTDLGLVYRKPSGLGQFISKAGGIANKVVKRAVGSTSPVGATVAGVVSDVERSGSQYGADPYAVSSAASSSDSGAVTVNPDGSVSAEASNQTVGEDIGAEVGAEVGAESASPNLLASLSWPVVALGALVLILFAQGDA